MFVAESSAQPLARATYQDHDLDDMDKVHDARKRSFYCNIALVAVAFIALASVNILARYDYFDLKTISIINTSALGLGAVTAFGSLLFYEEAKSNWTQETLLVAAVVLTVCATLSSLGLFKVFNTTQVTWTVFAPILAASGLALNAFLNSELSSGKKPSTEKQILAISFTCASIAINILALYGKINVTTLATINTFYWGVGALFVAWKKFHHCKFNKPIERVDWIVFLINATATSLCALGISGHLSMSQVAWISLGATISAYTLALGLYLYYRRQSFQYEPIE